ncbi:DUF2637 domain-containing protein [Nocardia ninae]|uniref:DUF2637 domain-containing protein n=1 Tax=Nocardia ninae TaxID=356145 RepID=UPI001FE97C21|nr:DUF2637 domain-containing protein [Nocardia ninae]
MAGKRWARWSAVVITVIIGVAAFVVSFAALRDLAILANTPKRWAWLFPVIIDGTIIQATISALVLPERRWFSWVLGIGALVSIAGNSLHAVAAGQVLPWWASALVAAIAPVSLLVDTHGLALLFRATQPGPAVAVDPVGTPADPVAELSADPLPEPVSEPVAPSPVEPLPAPAPVARVRPAPKPVRSIRPVRPVQEALPITVS